MVWQDGGQVRMGSCQLHERKICINNSTFVHTEELSVGRLCLSMFKP